MRPPLVQKMLDKVKKQGDYYEDVPKHWMSDEHGMEHALVKYVESLEAELQQVKDVAVAASNDAERALREADLL
jgi:hypothetical protein